MLVGRERERERIDQAVELARARRSTALVLCGEPGIGKSALLAYAAERAAGMLVLSARGAESESEIAFSGLFDLLRPALGSLGAIPGPQRTALEGALALGPAIEVDRFATYAAALNLLAAAAEDAPVLALVDDLQWLDTASAEAILFVARRVRAEGIALLLGLRDEQPASLDTAGIATLRVEGLGWVESLGVLETAAPGVGPAAAERICRATGGNPLALTEIPLVLTPAQLAGDEPIDEPLPVGASVEAAFLRRLTGLAASARHALLLAAASDADDLAVVLRAAGDPRGPVLEEAERQRLVSVGGGRFEFRHPLVRSTVYHAAGPEERRSAHRALADALADAPGARAAARRAWHLAAAAVGPDEEVSLGLELAARAALAQTGYAAAASGFERAARLSAAPARLLREAADAWRRAGRTDRALALLEEALREAPDDEAAAETRHLRAVVEIFGGDVKGAGRQLVGEAERIEGRYPKRAARMLDSAVMAHLVAGEFEQALPVATRAYEIARRAGGATEVLAALQLGKALVLAGDETSGRPHLMRYAELTDGDDPLLHAFELAQCAPALMSIEEYARAEGLLRHVVAAARGAHALGLLAYSLGAQAELDARLGRFTAAYAGGFEAAHLAEAAGQRGQLAYNLARLARVEAVQGREDACRAHASRALAIGQELGADQATPFAESALGLLELSAGRAADSIPHLEETRRAFRGVEPGRLEWEGDLVEAYARDGRTDDAREALEAFERRARPGGRALALAAAARCRGILATDGFEEHFEAALVWHARTPTPFERARTELAFGERLRRSKERRRSRDLLSSALATFERLGTAPWAERARQELRASGERIRRGAAADRDALTAQELQVALVVSEGASNREAASRLFVSPKTIEFHLANAYRKLGVRSRTELAHVLADHDRPGERGEA